MTSLFDSLNLLGITIDSLVLSYTTFWALNVRKALAIRPYRHQALGIALIASTLALNDIGSTVAGYLIYHNPLNAIGQGGLGFFFVFLVVLFYWIDSSAVAARRSDLLGRDILYWSKLRVVLWILVLPAPLLVIPVDIYSLFTVGGYLPGGPPAWSLVILVPGIIIPPVSALVILPVILRRTTDPALRRHLKWFVLFVAVFLVLHQFFGNQPDQTVALFYVYLGSIVGGYCLYKSVLSLTPRRPVSLEDSAESASVERSRLNHLHVACPQLSNIAPER